MVDDPAPPDADEDVHADLGRFDAIFSAQRPRLVRIASAVLADAAAAEDVVQEAFARLADDPVLDRPDGEVAAWLRRVCINTAFNHRRGERRRTLRQERVGRLDGAAEDPVRDEPLTAVVRAEEHDRVRATLAALDERARAVLLLRHSGCTYAEIATTVGVAPTSVGTLLARAERAFRSSYEESDR